MARIEKLVVFALSDFRCAMPLSDVERVLRAVEIKFFPKAPDIIIGFLNLQGRIIPVLNIRKFFRLPEIGMTLNDQIIIAHMANIPIAILVNEVFGISEYNEADIFRPDAIFPGIEYLEGVAKLEDGIVYIYSLDRLLSSREKSGIEHLLSTAESLPDLEER